MPVVPAGSFSLPASKLMRMLSLSSTFQNTIAAAHGIPVSEASALNFIFMRRVPPTVNRPFAIITLGDHHQYQLVAGGSQNHLRVWGGLFLFLTQPTNSTYFTDPVQADYDAGNFFGQVVDDVAVISGQDDPGSSDGTSHLNIVRIHIVPSTFGENPIEDHASSGRYYTTMYSVHHGDDDRGMGGTRLRAQF